MLPLKGTPREPLPEVVELPEENDPNHQIARVPSRAASRHESPDAASIAQSDIHRALAILRADLQTVEEAILDLELIAQENRTLDAPIPKPSKVIEIRSKRA
jgi:hypothetical protein